MEEPGRKPGASQRIARISAGNGPTWVEIEDDRLVGIGDDPFQPARGAKLGSLADAKLLAPIAATNKVIGLMGNFMGPSNRRGAGLFIKPSTTIVGHGDQIIWPAGVAQVNFEAELGVVIGARARQVAPENALDYVFGYTVTNDVTSFSTLAEDGAAALSLRFKMYDTFLPIGPWITTGIHADDLRLTSRLNGVTKQDVSLATMDFDVAHTVAWVSSVMTLDPGDIISMGTPPGYADMAAGDLIECEIEGIGVLANRLVRP